MPWIFRKGCISLPERGGGEPFLSRGFVLWLIFSSVAESADSLKKI
jgi:hypothetical protein